MNVTTWNVNSIRARHDRVLEWVDARAPDVLCLQELKCVEEEFPHAEFRRRGYAVAVHGQKTYNGVAILSRHGLEDVAFGLPWPEDPQARGIAATVAGVRILDVYVVNGQAVGSDKYAYKMQWLERLHACVAPQVGRDFVLCGDFNIAPADADVHDPAAWAGQILVSEPERAAFRGLLELGLTDAFRARHAERAFTWWDYRNDGFGQDAGLRIDHHLVSASLLPRVTEVSIDRGARGLPSASDHAPVTLHLRD